MKNKESEEMYLETILLLLQKNANVRSIDIMHELGYAKSSVSRAVNLLCDKGFLIFNEHGAIEFTESGRTRAEAILERHKILTEALMIMGADVALAEQNACKIEHVIDEQMFEIIKSFTNQ